LKFDFIRTIKWRVKLFIMDFFPRFKCDYVMIVIVSGLPRSGTSMMMGMLKSGGFNVLIDDVRTADEDNPKGYYEFERVKKMKDGDTNWIYLAKNKVVKVISYHLKFLPNEYHYKIVFMEREMKEILISQNKMMLRRGETNNTISDEDMTRYFQKHLEQVKKWLESQSNFETIYMNYNKLVKNPTAEIRTLNQFFNENLNTSNMIESIDKSLYRSLKKVLVSN